MAALWRWGAGNREVWLSALIAPLLAATIGVYLLLAPARAVTGPVYNTARDLLPLRWWGVLFVAKAIAGAAAFCARSWLNLYRVMVIGMALYVVWAGISAYTALSFGWVGTIGAGLWGWAAFTHYLMRRRMLGLYRAG